MGLGIGLTKYAHILLYAFSIMLILVVIIRDPRFGILYFLPLIPLRVIFVRMYELPLGKDIIDLMVLAIILGWCLHNREFVKTKVNIPLYIYFFLTLISLLIGSNYLGTGFPGFSDARMQTWKDYALLPIIFFIVLNNIKRVEDIRRLVFIISLVFLLIVVKFWVDFQDTAHYHFNDRLRTAEVFVHLGANPFAAFLVEYMIIFLTIQYFFEKNKRLRIYYFFVALVSFYPILFLYSRAAYIATIISLLVLGIMKDRRILGAFFGIILFWQIVVPNSVLERINTPVMSESEIGENEPGRLVMWKNAYETFKSKPLFGVGFRVFDYIEFEDAPTSYSTRGRAHTLRNAHSLYLQTLAEMGIIGFSMLIFLFFSAFRSGWKLFRTSQDKYLKGLGLGFSLCVISVVTTNIFGDRWFISIIQVYYWIFWALVERGLLITQLEKKI